MKRAILVVTLLTIPSLVFAQTPQNKEPMLIQLFEDVSRARQQAEIERAACQVQVKELEQRIQTQTPKDSTKK